MTAAVALAFPPGRVVAGWWRQLAPYSPQALWIGHLLVHRVEALARVDRPRQLDAFTSLLLQAVALAPGQATADLDRHLLLGAPVLFQLLRQLQGEGLLQSEAGGAWGLTPSGREALGQGQTARGGLGRMAFHFAEPWSPDERRGPPRFLAAGSLPGVSWTATEARDFDLAWLRQCQEQPPEWKAKRGFPAEVVELVGLGAADEAPDVPDWQRVILTRQEPLLTVFALAAREGGKSLFGFAAQPDGWLLQAGEPAFVLGEGWEEVFPELKEGVPAEAWRQAWLDWCQPRNVPLAECEACALERQDYRLKVRAPRKLVERLQAARSDALKGEAWLLAGEGCFREAALIVVAESR
jgi:hypothetical protein